MLAGCWKRCLFISACSCSLTDISISARGGRNSGTVSMLQVGWMHRHSSTLRLCLTALAITGDIATICPRLLSHWKPLCALRQAEADMQESVLSNSNTHFMRITQALHTSGLDPNQWPTSLTLWVDRSLLCKIQRISVLGSPVCRPPEPPCTAGKEKRKKRSYNWSVVGELSWSAVSSLHEKCRLSQ